MTPVLQSLQLFLLAGVSFMVAGAALAAGITVALSRILPELEPGARHRVLLLVLALPLLAGVGLLFFASLPSLFGLVVPGLDHCPTHDDHHAHLCFIHLPSRAVSAAPLLAVVFLVTYAGVRAALAAADILRAVRVARALERSGVACTELDATVIESPRPVCLTVGLSRSRVLVSRGLLSLLDASERSIVLEHERAHVRRGDALLAMVARACALFHLPPVARWLLRELQIAAEQACDEAAADAAGDRAAVAAVILKVETAVQHRVPDELQPVAVGFGECAVARRVDALLAAPRAPMPVKYLQYALVIAVLALFASASGLHHTTESLLSVITE